MTALVLPPKTYLSHENNWKLHQFLEKMFRCRALDEKVREFTEFLRNHPLPLEDFPSLEGTYTRTVLYREENGYEAMAARWQKGTLSSIHGHPYFNMYFVVHGCLKVDDYVQSEQGLVLSSEALVEKNQVSSFTGNQGTFDNDIHQVHAIEETLSIHISSDDSTKGQIYSGK